MVIALDFRRKRGRRVSYSGSIEVSNPAFRERRGRFSKNMYYVYVLKLNKNTKKNFYVGYSSDLKGRIIRHKKGLVKTTNNKNPKLIYYEAYISEKMARRREINLKKFGSAYKGLLKRIEENNINAGVV